MTTTTTWLYGLPKHPFFDQEELINSLVADIKTELFSYMMKGLRIYKHELKIPDRLYCTLETHPLIWDLAFRSQRYGAIYWLSRQEARQNYMHVIECAQLLDEIAYFLMDSQAVSRIFNYAIHHFILSRSDALQFSNELIPKFAIYSTGANLFCVREHDFIHRALKDSFFDNNALYDLHDFAHSVTATLSPELYGSHYFNALIHLPISLQNLIKSRYYKTEKTHPFSDSLIYRELSLVLFNQINYQQKSFKQIVSQLANQLAAYLLNETALLHGSTGKWLKPNRVLTIIELATLVQNKSYELPASEIEQKIFTRCGDDGHDPLKNLRPSERIKFLANLDSWLYFEARNTLRHRAHQEAYKIIAYTFIKKASSQGERILLSNIIENINYKDFYRKRRINLWQVILKMQNQETENYHIFPGSQMKIVQKPMLEVY